jgi:aspartyl-tRNA(Asn)/glutamyl-tRNA(Gln) amidotransferase subunit A
MVISLVTDDSLATLSISELAPMVKEREVSPVEIVDTSIARIERLQPQLKGFILEMFDDARDRAKLREKAIMRGEYLGPLDGIPVGIKDNLAVGGVPATVGALANADFIPEEDAAAVHKLRAAGAIIIGKENMHEFAAGGRSNNPYYGAVKNPWALDRIPGGSSGGGGANVAACLTFASLGTDVAGSVRFPAHCCGVVGMKATFGRVSQRGSLLTWGHGDHVGPLTRTVADSALLLQACAGHDPRDASSRKLPVPDFSARLGKDLKGVKLGIPGNFFFDVVSEDVEEKVRKAIDVMAENGAELVEVDLPWLEYSRSVWLMMAVESAVTHEKLLREKRSQISEELVLGMLAGQFIPARDYIKARKLQRLIKEGFAAALAQVDALVSPTSPAVAPHIDARSLTINGTEYDLELTRDEVLGRDTYLANVTGIPAISLPCGFGEAGMPVGLQLMGKPFEEDRLYQIAYACEQALPTSNTLPPLARD